MIKRGITLPRDATWLTARSSASGWRVYSIAVGVQFVNDLGSITREIPGDQRTLLEEPEGEKPSDKMVLDAWIEHMKFLFRVFSENGFALGAVITSQKHLDTSMRRGRNRSGSKPTGRGHIAICSTKPRLRSKS